MLDQMERRKKWKKGKKERMLIDQRSAECMALGSIGEGADYDVSGEWMYWFSLEGELRRKDE